MKLSTHPMHDREQFNGFQQIIAHLGGMAQAFLKHYPINWTFHWRGICRAILPESVIASKRVKRSRTQAQ